MDGIAISMQHFEKGQREFLIEGIQAAGQPQQILNETKKCFEVMTGAPLPVGTDTVIPYESVSIENGTATLSGPVAKSQNVHHQGRDARQNEILLDKGCFRWQIGSSSI
jgi:molybdopterin molybdotransferase